MADTVLDHPDGKPYRRPDDATPIIPMRTSSLFALLFRVALLLPPPLLMAADFVWTGGAGPGFSTAGSWAGAVAPTADMVNRTGKFYVTNGDKAPLIYTEREGKTVLECDDFKIGSSALPGGALSISGGELTVVSRWSPMVGHNNNRTSTLVLTGGRFTIRSAPGAKESELNFRVGNWKGANTRGVVDVSGGFLVIETPGNAAAGGFAIAHGDANGEVLLDGGMIVVTSVYGTSFQAVDGAAGLGVLTFGPGEGVFMQTDSKRLIFGSASGATASHINFVKGSRGQISLAGATRDDYENWVRTGRIRLSGQTTTPDKFHYTEIQGQGIYQLAPSR